jgi:DNA invertase Pin-like site-specific DNA recombinase
LDRFSREGVTETLNHLKLLDNYDVGWKSFTESYLDSTGMFKEAVIAILAAVAKQEHARLSERVVEGLRRAKREGKALGRPKVIVDRDKIQSARTAGMSLRQIGAEFGISRTLVMNLLSA